VVFAMARDVSEEKESILVLFGHSLEGTYLALLVV